MASKGLVALEFSGAPKPVRVGRPKDSAIGWKDVHTHSVGGLGEAGPTGPCHEEDISQMQPASWNGLAPAEGAIGTTSLLKLLMEGDGYPRSPWRLLGTLPRGRRPVG